MTDSTYTARWDKHLHSTSRVVSRSGGSAPDHAEAPVVGSSDGADPRNSVASAASVVLR